MVIVNKIRKTINGNEIILLAKKNIAVNNFLENQEEFEKDLEAKLTNYIDDIFENLSENLSTGVVEKRIIDETGKIITTTIPIAGTEVLSSSEFFNIIPNEPVDKNIVVYDSEENYLVWTKYP